MMRLVVCAVVCAVLFVPGTSAAPFTLFSTFGPGDSFNSGSGWTIGYSGVGDGWTTAAQFTPSITAPLAAIELAAFWVQGNNSLEIDLCPDSSGEPG